MIRSCLNESSTPSAEALEQQRRDTTHLEAIGRLAGGVAHEFNNLLMIILSNVQLAQEQIAVGESAAENFQEVIDACDRAADLTQQLLAFGRRQLQKLEEFEVNDVAAETLRFAKRVIGENIETEFVPGGDCGAIRADRGQVKQLLLNLFLNARDAMRNGGKVTLKTGSRVSLGREHESVDRVPAGEYVVIEVADNGPGMDDDVKARVFEPFFTTKECGQGTGLGLATVYGIVRQNSGFIFLKSELGKGTTFRIYFPAVAPASTEQGVAEELAALAGSELVLLVEDEEALRSAVKRYLISRGFRVIEARNGEDACTACESLGEKLQLILSDVVMPKMSGLEMVRTIREKNPGVPVIFMTGYSESPLEPVANASLLRKPFNMATLTVELHKHLARGQLV
jgi:two-component system cell cycle sensor histidine kinase/response regulator CckA